MEKPHPANLTNLLNLYYSSDGGQTFSSSAPINAGDYEVYYTFAGNTNYQAVTTYTDSGQAVDIAGPVNVSADVSLSYGGYLYSPHLREFAETVTITITNTSSSALAGPLALQLNNLTNATLVSPSGTDANGDPYVNLSLTNGELAAGQSITVVLYFQDPTFDNITFDAEVMQNE